jgi:hypothetical protein
VTTLFIILRKRERDREGTWNIWVKSWGRGKSILKNDKGKMEGEERCESVDEI